MQFCEKIPHQTLQKIYILKKSVIFTYPGACNVQENSSRNKPCDFI